MGEKNKGTFKKGVDARRNVTGANKGSKWRKNLLEELLTTPIGVDSEDEEFAKMVDDFPQFFNGKHETNYQLFIELKQLQLTQSKDDRIAQSAIKEIKDRIQGQSNAKHSITTENKEVDLSSLTDEELMDYVALQKKVNGGA